MVLRSYFKVAVWVKVALAQLFDKEADGYNKHKLHKQQQKRMLMLFCFQAGRRVRGRSNLLVRKVCNHTTYKMEKNMISAYAYEKYLLISLELTKGLVIHRSVQYLSVFSTVVLYNE